MSISLQTPIITSVGNLAVTFLNFSYGPTDAQTVATLGYAPCNAQGQVVPGSSSAVVTLAAADLAAYNANPGTPRQKAEAALASNLGISATAVAT